MSDSQSLITNQRLEPRISGLVEIGRRRFDYDPSTGELRFRDPGRDTFSSEKGYRIFCKKFVGKVAGSISKSDGYCRVVVLGQSIMAHRLIWAMLYGRDPGATIDHRDGVRSNNRPRNLRDASRSQNAMNRGPRSDCSSGVRGVHWHKASGKWVAAICAGGVSRHLGLFHTKEDARSAFIAASNDFHGEFAAHRGVLQNQSGVAA